jgi:iron complex transport system substrate-binding protein
LNLEAVAKADPDLIIATSDFLPLDDPMREELEKIAPILTFEARDGEAWRTRATELAEIFEKTDELEPVIEEYDARRDEIADEYSAILDEYAVTVFGPEPDEWGTYAETHFITPILRDLGAKFREQQDDEVTEDGFPQWFSYEELDRISNADVIFMRSGVSEEQKAALAGNTIWQNLPAVQNEMVFDYIERGPTGSYGWALGNLDDLEALFGQVQAKVDAQG